MKTNYERKELELEKQRKENRPTLSIFSGIKGPVSTATLKSTREEVQLNYRIFKQLCQKGRSRR